MNNIHSIPMNCPHCGGSIFNVYQIVDRQGHRHTIEMVCPSDGTIMYADSVIELSTRFPDRGA